MALKSPRFSGNPQLQKAANNSPALRKGTSGDGVRLLQQALIDLDYPMPITVKAYGTPDGVFGKETKQRVIEFQEDHVLVPDGVVGAKTMEALDKKFPNPGPPLPPLEPFDYQVPGIIKRVDQNGWMFGDSLCWAAAITMMFSWRDQTSYSGRDLMDRLGVQFRLLFELGQTLPNYLYPKLLQNAGMRTLTPVSLTAYDWLNLMRSHGMLWVGALSNVDIKTAYRHAFIVYGLMPGPAGGQHMRMINPTGARDYNINFGDFTAMFEEAEGPDYPQIRFFPSGR